MRSWLLSKRFDTVLSALLTGVLWIGLGQGPHSIPAQAAQGYTWSNAVTGGGGGFVDGVVFNASQRDLVYARTDIGGAYRWNPGAGSWTPLLDWISPADWNLTGVESIASDPVHPNRLYLAVGTYTNSFTTQNGAILISNDQGATFSRVDLPFKLGSNMPGRGMGERLAIDPNDDSVLYLGTRSGNGLWRSTDGGLTWSRVTSFPATGTYVEQAGDPYLGDPDGVTWETFDPRSGSTGHPSHTIYVGVADVGTSIYRSTDGGATWAAVPGEPTGFLPHHGVLASNGMLYVTYSNGDGPYNGTSGDVWKLDTGSGAWTKISPVPSTDTANDYFGYGGLAVDAQHPATLVVASLNSWWPDAILFRSTDGGATWNRIWEWASYPNRTLHYTQDTSAAPWLDFGVKNATPPVPAVKVGWMIDAMAIDPFSSDHLLYGTGATLYGTNNLTAWDTGGTVGISVMAKGIEETSVQDLISPPSGAHLVSGLGDVGGFVHNDLTTSPPEMFTSPVFTTTTSLDYAEKSPGFVVRAGNPPSGSGSNSAAFSFDGGADWFQASSQPSVSSGGTIAAAADASRVVWSPGGGAVSVSTNNGSSWTASSGIASGAVVRSDRVNPMTFYGFSGGTFYISTNGGATFTATAASGLPSSQVSFKAVPGHEGDVWLAGAGAGLWHSTDGGATFTKLSNVTAANTIGFGMAAPGQSYDALFTSATIGGVSGIFRSDDAGATWVRVNDDQHQYGSTNAAITGDPRIYGRVYVSTNGRGIVYGDISGSGGPTPTPTPTPSSTPSSTPTPTPRPTPTGGAGGVTLTPVVKSSSAYYTEEDLQLANTSALSSLSITITVQQTGGLSFNGQYNTVGSTIQQTHAATASAVTYQFDLAPGQTLGTGTTWTFAAQTGGSGTAHGTSGDTFTVTSTTGGTTSTQSGHF